MGSMVYLVAVCLLATSAYYVSADLCTQDVCEYELVIQRERTMTYTIEGKPLTRTYNVGLNGSKLTLQSNDWNLPSDPNVGTVVDKNDVITADGFSRALITVNGQFPGPAIEVMHGAEVVVRVKNELLLEETGIHWHGLHMINTPWMDGVPMLTQCPIMPGQEYTYRFIADPVGTHWYHSHSPAQRIDGLYGFLVVHEHMPRYPGFNVFVSDWLHDDNIITYEMDSATRMGKPGSGDNNVAEPLKYFMVDNTECASIAFRSCVIDGRGRYDDQPFPLTEYTITRGQRYRMRLVNSGIEFAFEISMDNHRFDVVALDGVEISPITVDSFIMFAGETIDVEFAADQPVGKYWMRSNILSSGVGHNPVPDGIEHGCKAIIAYDGTTQSGEPTTSMKNCLNNDHCNVFNCPFEYYLPSYNKDCIHLDDARSIQSQAEMDRIYGLQESDDNVLEYFINIGFGVGPHMNGRRNVELPVPIFASDIEDHLTPCDPDECVSTGCVCVHTESLPYNRTVQLVLSNLAQNFPSTAHHSLHLHGHSFAVLKMAEAPLDPATGFGNGKTPDLTCNEENPSICAKPRWTASRPLLNKDNPPVKDTIVIPGRGYVVVRFRTENPGHWMMHCHQELHVLEGMAMTFIEAVDQIKPLPKNFPTCGGFDWSQEEFKEYLEDDKTGYTSPPTCVPEGGTTDSTTPATATTTTTTTSTPRDEKDEPSSSDHVSLEMKTAIGAAFGFLLTGAVIALVPVIIFLCCDCRRGRGGDTSKDRF